MWKLRTMVQQQPIWIFCDGSTGALYGAEQTQGSAAPPAPSTVRTLLRSAMHCAAAAVAYSDTGTILDWAWQQLAPLTNNEAEYAGLVLGLELAQRLQAQTAICVLDNAVVVGQMEGRFAVNNARMRRYYWQAQAAARQIPNVRYCQAPREWNRVADGLAAQASVPWPVLKAALTARVTGD